MAITDKQRKYAQLVANSGKPPDELTESELQTLAMDAGSKSHDAARKFVTAMNKNAEVQALICNIIKARQQLNQGATSDETQHLSPEFQRYEKPLDYLTAVFNDTTGMYAPKERIQAAVALLPYTADRIAGMGKKENAIETAKQLAQTGSYATAELQGDIFEQVLQ